MIPGGELTTGDFAGVNLKNIIMEINGSLNATPSGISISVKGNLFHNLTDVRYENKNLKVTEQSNLTDSGSVTEKSNLTDYEKVTEKSNLTDSGSVTEKSNLTIFRRRSDDRRFHLRRGSRKDICPRCGRKTFTPYVDQNENLLSEIAGMCDRKDKCAYHYSVSDYFKDNPHCRTLSSDRIPKRKTPVYRRPAYLNPSLVEASLSRNSSNSLTDFLSTFFRRFGMESALKEALALYNVGTSFKFNGSPIFWLIDNEFKVRDGKIMGYDSITGRRIKKPFPQFTTVSTLIARKTGKPREDCKGCYFGSHLTAFNNFPDLPVFLLESEKAALILATVMIWGGVLLGIPIATGGCGSLNPTSETKRDPYGKIRVLKGKTVVLFPDNGKYEEWRKKGRMLSGYASNVYLASVMEPDRHPFSYGVEIENGEGIDDLIMKILEVDTPPYDSLASLLTTSYGQYDRSLL